MKIVVTAEGADLEARFSRVFGRCPTFLVVDSDTMACEAVANAAAGGAGGAGVQAAQLVADRGVAGVVTGQVGPNAYRVLEAAGIPVYTFDGGSAREAVEAYRLGHLRRLTGASAAPHSGMSSA